MKANSVCCSRLPTKGYGKRNSINIDNWKECVRFLKTGEYYSLVLGD